MIGVRPAVKKIGMLERLALIRLPIELAVPAIVWTIITCGRPVTIA